MTAREIAEERRRGRVAAVAAIVAGVLFPAGLVWSLSVNGDRPDNNDPAELRFADDHATELIAAAALRSVALLLMAVVAVHLYRATKARNPQLNQVVLVMGLVGPIAFALGNLAFELFFASAAADFTGREFQTIDAAKDLLDRPGRIIAGAVTSAGSLALAFWFVVGSLNAMRVGLLTRFMGVLGIVIGPGLLLLPPTPFVMTVWFIGVGLLFLGRWPRGLPPAWVTGEAVPWPSARRDDASTVEPEEAGGTRNGEVEAVGSGVRPPARKPEPSSEGERRPRKRKRR